MISSDDFKEAILITYVLESNFEIYFLQEHF